MQKRYSINELVEFAVQIEKRGAAFYEKMAAAAKEPSVREVFEYLRDQELKHQELYAKLLTVLNDQVNVDTIYDDDYHNYLGAIVQNVVFKDLGSADGSIPDTAAAVDYAIAKEKDSIFFYNEMKNFVAKDNHAVIDEIIKEEQNHILKLLDIEESM